MFCGLLSLLFMLRYRVKVEGLDKLNKDTLSRPGGVLFLPNHSAVFIDPAMVSVSIWGKFPLRPMVVEYFYYTPILHTLFEFIRAVPIPDFDRSSNSLKKKRSEEVVCTVIDALKHGDNFLVYPAGRTKSTAHEIIGGASAIHRIMQDAPETNVVLVRSKGLWGSSFSRIKKGTPPPLYPTLFENFKHLLKNFIFFMPKRDVTIVFEPAPADFPRNGTRMEINRWLENWYNKPDGLTTQQGAYPGDSPVLVSYSRWKDEFLELEDRSKEDTDYDINTISPDVKAKVIAEVARVTKTDPSTIRPDMAFDSDLGLDSLDVAELAAYVHHMFGIKRVNVIDLSSVGRMMAIADKKIICKDVDAGSIEIDKAKWSKFNPGERLMPAEGKTVPEAFLNNCAKRKNLTACADERTGVLTYKELKLRAILLAEYIRHLPGQYIGILLPSSAASYITVLATQLAGKTPLMVNWTVGPRHLEAVKNLSKVEVVLSSWAFLDRLENVDLDGIDDCLIMLEDVRRKLSLSDKIRAYLRSLRSTKSILKAFKMDNASEDDIAVLLFTSGTESLPKGVPLSHRNVLTNERGLFELIPFYGEDILLGMLPPFHSFGFSITGIMSLLAGLRIFYFPDPTDGPKMAALAKEWGITVLCGAPTFLKGIFKAGTPDCFTDLRICGTGAEKAPPELFSLVKDLGKEGILVEGYGITECSPILTFNIPGETPAGVGQPVSGVDLLIVHPESYDKLPQGATGLLLVKGPNVFAGYINPDVLSPFVKIDGDHWYKTGDLGYLDDKGNFIISGRQKRFIKVGGEMVSLSAIEDAFLKAAKGKGWPVSDEGPTLAICAKEKAGEKPKITLFGKFTTSVDEANTVLRDAGFTNLVKVTETKQLDIIPVMGTGKINYRDLESRFMN